MGQKVNPIGMRIGIIRDWDAKWYASKTKVADLLHEERKGFHSGGNGHIDDRYDHI